MKTPSIAWSVARRACAALGVPLAGRRRSGVAAPLRKGVTHSPLAQARREREQALSAFMVQASGSGNFA